MNTEQEDSSSESGCKVPGCVDCPQETQNLSPQVLGRKPMVTRGAEDFSADAKAMLFRNGGQRG